MRRIWSGIVVAAMVVLGLGGPALAQEANSSEATGSVLVFAKFLRGTVTVGKTNAGAPILEPRSSFNISVTCPPGGTCAEGAKVKLLARWVCPATQDFRDKFICKATNFELVTTMKGTVTFNPESVGTRTAGLLIPKPPCEKGYLIVWVVSPADASALSAIKFDALAGNAVLRNGNSSANAYTAVPIQAVSSLATGDRTDVNHDGRLAFDGQTEYKALTGRLAGPVRYSRSAKVPGTNLGRIDTVLTLLTLDTLVQRSNFPTFVDYHFFNEAEALISTSHEFICWTEVKLTDIDSNLDEFFGTGGHNGLFETTEAEKIGFAFGTDTAGPVTLLGIAETSERNAGGAIIREYAYSLVNGGTLVPTIFAP